MITTDITSTADNEIPNSSPSDVIIRSKAELFGRGKLLDSDISTHAIVHIFKVY